MKATRFMATIAILSAMLITSCSKDDHSTKDDNQDKPSTPSTTALVSRIEFDNGLWYNFYYDSKDQLSKVHEHDVECETIIEYQRRADGVTITTTDLTDDEKTIVNGNLDNGKISSAFAVYPGGKMTDYYHYNGNQMISYNDIFTGHTNPSLNEHSIEWTNQCVSKVSLHNSYNQTYTTEYAYTNIKNKLNIDIAELGNYGMIQTELAESESLFLRSAGLAGSLDNYLLKHISSSRGSRHDGNVTLEYTLNDEGLPITLKIIETYDDDPEETVTNAKITYSNNDEPQPPTPATTALVSQVEINYADENGEREQVDWFIAYDQNNNIKSIDSRYGDSDEDASRLNYSRTGNTLTVTEIDMERPNEIAGELKATLDDKGRITSAKYSYEKNGPGIITTQNLACTYSNTGELMSLTNDYYGVSSKFTWNNGSLSKCDNGSHIGQQYSSQYENRTNIDFTTLCYGKDLWPSLLPPYDVLSYWQFRSAGYLGNKDKYLPSKIEFTENRDVSNPITAEYQYKFDDKGLPTTIVIRINTEDALTATMNITYKK